MAAMLEVRNTPYLFREYLDEASACGHRFYVYAQDGAILGFVRLKQPKPSDGPTALRPRISDLYVSPQHRNRGIGSAIIAECESLARKLGHGRLYIGVDPVENPRMFQLCRGLGYVPIHEQPFQGEMLFHNTDGSPPIKKTYWRIDLVKVLWGD